MLACSLSNISEANRIWLYHIFFATFTNKERGKNEHSESTLLGKLRKNASKNKTELGKKISNENERSSRRLQEGNFLIHPFFPLYFKQK